MKYYKYSLFTTFMAFSLIPMAHSQVEDCTFIPSLWKFGYRDRNNNQLETKDNSVSQLITDAFEVELSNDPWFKEGIVNRLDIKELLRKKSLEEELTDSDKGKLSKESNIFISGYYTLDRKTSNGVRVSFYTVYVAVKGFDSTNYGKHYETLTEDELDDPAVRRKKMKHLVSLIVRRLEIHCGKAPPPPPPPPIGTITEIVLTKAKELGRIIQHIADKEVKDNKKNGLIELALSLFYSKSCQIEVSSKRGTITSYPIAEYFRRLRRLGYKKIDLKWVNIGIIKRLKPMKDKPNVYKGIIEIEQVFKGYNNVSLVTLGLDGVRAITNKELISYEDITTKHIEVFVKISETHVAGKEQSKFEVLFCEMKVFQTR